MLDHREAVDGSLAAAWSPIVAIRLASGTDRRGWMPDVFAMLAFLETKFMVAGPVPVRLGDDVGLRQDQHDKSCNR